MSCIAYVLTHPSVTELLLQITVRKRYEAMRDALNATGKPILFSMCEWGVSSPWEYGHQVPVPPNFLMYHTLLVSLGQK